MKRIMICTLIGATGFALSACNDSNNDNPAEVNQVPGFIQGDIQRTDYDGITDDLLTAGLGATGLRNGPEPIFLEPLNPTSAELRQRAIYNNYRALVDTTSGGGYGEFFGPGVGNGTEGLIPGREYIAFMTVPGSDVPVTVMAQIPDSFDPQSPCMITAPSSGSRGIYGAIGTAGEWGLKKGCVVVYTDKGSGTGAHNLETNTAQRMDGTLTTSDEPVQFRADLTATERSEFSAAWPDRFAWKHAHSKTNPEADWGQHVLQSVEFGFWALNEQFGSDSNVAPITPANTVVIASSVSNGGGSSVRAAEQDTKGLIDGVAVSEPNVNPVVDASFTIKQGSNSAIEHHSRSLLEYTTALAVYQGCANQAPAIRDIAPLNFLNSSTVRDNICNSLANKGLLTGAASATIDDYATEAQRILNEDFGIQPEQNLLAPVHFASNVSQGISMTYVNAYGRAGVEDRVCGLSMAATDGAGVVRQLTQTEEAALFAVSNGIPPTGNVNIVYDLADGQPTRLTDSASPSSLQKDYGLDALLCLHSLALGRNVITGGSLSVADAKLHDAITVGIEEVRATGDLHGKPAVFVTGRADAILPINHTSRPYFGLNQRVEGASSELRYYEVLNAHHLDILNQFDGIGTWYVPLHHYYFQALDLVWERLTNGTELPPSQVVRTVPRGDLATPLAESNLPEIAAQPAPEDLISLVGDELRIPE
ncbi:hydroxybutyrate-dimer hydrolase [Marinobacter antarcticus]|uniref:Hydroxybutyrate-dimer hydrolase n=1 Tax=Marinobacter antarcticus TaxID=564117 RepID=A0A1M6PT80_9GAMM|nr:3-hydroxybutyrate oligomer hydrolase family protein [Marinobacter antarcticus]SHK11157.1 hydroxybutyrate-dimer hydrolase [Marinobacter antarcticus]